MILNILKANDEIKALTALVDEKNATINELTNRVAQLKSEMETAEGAAKLLAERAEKAEAAIVATTKTDEDFAAEVAKAASAKALEIVAAQGVAPVRAEKSGDVAKTRDELWAEYQAQPTQAAKSDFYRKHRAQLFN